MDFRFFIFTDRRLRPYRSLVCGSLAPFLLGAFLVFSSGGKLPAQQPKPTEISKFRLSATQLGNAPLPALYWLEVVLDAEGKEQRTFKPFPVPNGSRGTPVEISLLQSVNLYTGTFDEKGRPQMKPFLAIPAKSPKDRLLLVFHQDAQGKTQQKFLNDSEEAHRGGSIRFVNFGLERAAFSAGGATTVVVPGGEATAIPVANSEGRYPFTYSVGMRGRPPYESPTKLLRMLMPEQRLLILYTFLPETVTTEKSAPEGSADTKLVFQPMAYRLYDTL